MLAQCEFYDEVLRGRKLGSSNIFLKLGLLLTPRQGALLFPLLEILERGKIPRDALERVQNPLLYLILNRLDYNHLIFPSCS